MTTEHAQAVVIGGGVGGTSIAYHLTKLGWKEVVLLERADLTSGSTFHSAGLVGQLRSTTSLTRMMMYGTDLYRRLRDETGVDPGWHEVGSLRLASTPERMEELPRHLCANNMDRPIGAITYTRMLNARGGIEADFTVTRLGEERFLIVTGTAFGNRDLAWITRHLPDDGSVEARDITSARASLGLWGPRARDILGPLTRTDLGSDAFPYLTAREITEGFVPCLALRVTNVGELGWELYPPAEYGRALWRSIWEAGRPRGLVAGGYRAIEALRLEKGYRVWSSDITPEETPDEAGLAFAVNADKPGGFLGRDALLERRRQPLARRLRCLVLDEPLAVCLGNEPVRLDGEICGRVTSGGYGFSVERSIAYAYLPPERSRPGARVDIDVFGEWIGASVEREPLYDPSGDRIRA